MGPQKWRLTIVDRDLTRAMSLGVSMRGLFQPTIIQSDNPLREGIRMAAADPECTITRISQADSIVDLHGFLDALQGTATVFIADSLPLRPTIASAIRDAGDTVVTDTDAPAGIESTLIALLASRGGAR